MKKAGKLINQFASQVRFLREASGLTREQLAERAGISPQNIAKIEGGQRFVTADTLSSLAKALNCPVNELFIHGAGERPIDEKRPSLGKLEALIKNKSEKRLSLAHDLLARVFKELD